MERLKEICYLLGWVAIAFMVAWCLGGGKILEAFKQSKN